MQVGMVVGGGGRGECESDSRNGTNLTTRILLSCRIYAYPFGILAGLIFGSYYGLQSGAYATIIPGGQEALYTAVVMCVMSVGRCYTMCLCIHFACCYFGSLECSECALEYIACHLHTQVVWQFIAVAPPHSVWGHRQPFSHAKSSMGFFPPKYLHARTHT